MDLRPDDDEQLYTVHGSTVTFGGGVRRSRMYSEAIQEAQRIYDRSVVELQDEWRRCEAMTFDIASWGHDWVDGTVSDAKLAAAVVVARKDTMLKVICDRYGVDDTSAAAAELNKLVRERFFMLRAQPDFKWK